MIPESPLSERASLSNALCQRTQEVKIASRLDHPNILNVIGANIGRHPPFVLYELMSGGSVEDYLESKRSKDGAPHAPPK